MPNEPEKPNDSSVPYRESGSGNEYNPQGNWGAERRQINPGDGGFGPEGDYSSAEGQPSTPSTPSTPGERKNGGTGKR